MRYWVLIPAFVLCGAAAAQPLSFGSADDPAETSQRTPWRRSVSLEVGGGLSLIGADWRAASDLALGYSSTTVLARLGATLRAGVDGAYRPDVDEAYDVLRMLDFLRLAPEPAGVYVRAGPSSRFRLGTGHLVNFFSTENVWDDRTIGLEAHWPGRVLDIAGVADDVRLNRMIAGRVALRPLFWASEPRARSLEIGGTYVVDRRRFRDELLVTAYGLDMRFTAANVGDVLLQPFATFSTYRHAGTGFGIGGELSSEDFVDVARFRLRLAVYVSDDGFVPGYLGPFYRVHNRSARILKTEDFSASDSAGAVVGTILAEAEGGTSIETELRVLFFERFEFWYNFRRHIGSQPLSESHIRLFFRSGRIAARLSQDRGGLKSFFTLFNDLGDQTAFQFRTDYHIARGIWLFVRAVYSYERSGRADDGSERYVVQRRFEPSTGMRFLF